MKRRFGFVLLCLLLVALLAPAAVILLYRVVPPPLTPLMVLRGGQRDYHWVPLARINPVLIRSVVTAADEAFCGHNGFDTVALEKAWDRYLQRDDDDDSPVRGGSTISQQTTKNLLLWPGRTWVRKGLGLSLIRGPLAHHERCSAACVDSVDRSETTATGRRERSGNGKHQVVVETGDRNRPVIGQADKVKTDRFEGRRGRHRARGNRRSQVRQS